MKTIANMELQDRKVLVRVDINVPIHNGIVGDETRIARAVPSINQIIEKGGHPVILSHLGRPKSKPVADLSLAQLVKPFEKHLGKNIQFCPNIDLIHGRSKNLFTKSATLLENVRFYPGETSNDPEFVTNLARWGDAYCNDAFSASHRNHASIVGLARALPCFAGNLLETEIENIDRILQSDVGPSTAIIGGAKISTKLKVLANLSKKVDCLLIGGAMANTILLAQGYEVGSSLVEKDHLQTALDFLKEAELNACKVCIPKDFQVAPHINHGTSTIKRIDTNLNGMGIFDLGPETIKTFENVIIKSKKVLWNGPLGAFEFPPFDNSTSKLGNLLANRTKSGDIISLIGGGDTIAALVKSNHLEAMSFVSTAGGAFIEYMEGKELPGINALET